MDYISFKQAVMEKAQEMNLQEYELYYTSSASTSISAFQHELNEFTSAVDGGVCFRCIVNGKMGYASTEELSPEQAAAIVEKAADHAAHLEAEEAVFLGEGGKTYQPLEDRSFPLPSTEEMIKIVLDTQEKLYASDPAVVDGCSTQGIAERNETAIFNSKGLDLHNVATFSILVVESVVTDGKEKTNDYQIKLGKLEEIDTKKLTGLATESALRQLGGDVAPTGQYPVIFNPEAMSSLLGVYSGIFSSEAAQKGLSKLAGQEGSAIASPLLTLVDDPFHPKNLLARNFDAEGSPAYKKNLIENGVFQTLLYNLKTAAVAGKETTGNAAKAGYDGAVGVSPTTLYITPGEISEEELLEKAGNGVYITSLGGLHAGANPISGDFSLQSSGFMIENGKKAGYVKSFTVAGNFYELLKQITAIASNLELPGMGRIGSPSILVEGLSIAGK